MDYRMLGLLVIGVGLGYILRALQEWLAVRRKLKRLRQPLFAPLERGRLPRPTRQPPSPPSSPPKPPTIEIDGVVWTGKECVTDEEVMLVKESLEEHVIELEDE